MFVQNKYPSFLIGLLCLIFFSVSIQAQTSFVVGKAPTYKGKEIALYTYSDLITYTPVKESFDTVNADGTFELSTTIKHPQSCIIKIDNQIGKLYMLTLFKYGIIFPAPDTAEYQNPNTDHSIDLIINGDSTELNARIIDFNQQFDIFWAKNYKYFVTKKIHHKLDSFQLKMEKRYEHVKSWYFKKYMKYTFALINDNTGRHSAYLMQYYILNEPILYQNYEYMEFFNQFFNHYLLKQTTGKFGNEFLDYINVEPSYAGLSSSLKKDPWLEKDSLRELVILKGLYELYYVPKFSKENILSIVEEIRQTTKIEEHKLIADNILRIFKNLKVGVKAPLFSLNDAKGKLYLLEDFKDKYVYLDFFSPKNLESQQEMKKLEQIKSKYGDKMIFISICMEGTEAEFKEFVKKNPKYNWLLLYGAKDKNLLESYMIKAPATYYLINREGFLVQSPAPKPSQGIELKFMEMFKVRKR